MTFLWHKTTFFIHRQKWHLILHHLLDRTSVETSAEYRLKNVNRCLEVKIMFLFILLIINNDKTNKWQNITFVELFKVIWNELVMFLFITSTAWIFNTHFILSKVPNNVYSTGIFSLLLDCIFYLGSENMWNLEHDLINFLLHIQ